jgi:hypothetical protein
MGITGREPEVNMVKARGLRRAAMVNMKDPTAGFTVKTPMLRSFLMCNSTLALMNVAVRRGDPRPSSSISRGRFQGCLARLYGTHN